MKTFLLSMVCVLINVLSPTLSAEGIDICIGLRDERGGGSINLNSLTKTTDEGDWVKGSGNTPEFIVKNSYKLKQLDGGRCLLFVNLLLRRDGSKDQNYTNTISVSKNGKISFKPFTGITMTVVSSGFLETKS